MVKADYCRDCAKDLAAADLKAGGCATCGKKPVKVEYCSKTDPATKTADRARIRYECPSCAATAEFETDLKHAEECKKKAGAPKKVCSKSGNPPHAAAPR